MVGSFADEYEFNPLRFIGEASGFSMDVVNTLVCVLLAYPLGILFTMIPTSMSSLRHAVCGSVGLAMCVLCFRIETMHLVIQMLITYFIINSSLPGKQNWALWYCVAHLSLSNLYHRIYHFEDYSLNVNGPLMIMTQKLSQLAFSVYDGSRTKEEKMKQFKTDKDGKLSRGDAAALAMFEELGIEKPPSLLALFGYCFSFFGVLLGPNHQFVDYLDLIEGRAGATPSTKFTGVIPGVKKFLFAVFWIVWSKAPAAMLGKLEGTPLGWISTLEIKHIALGEFLGDGSPNPAYGYTVLQKFITMMIAMQLYRCKFYFAWSLAEGACNTSGLGYQKNAKGEDWEKVSNVAPLQVEFPDNMKCILDNWNKQTQKWLVYVMYHRCRKMAVYKTMGLSMIWHGPYLGYVMTFCTAAFVTEGARNVRRCIRPLFMPIGYDDKTNAETFKKSSFAFNFYCVCSTITTLIVLNYMTGPFVMLTAAGSMEYWRTFSWSIHFVIAFGLVVPYLPLPKPGSTRTKKE